MRNKVCLIVCLILAGCNTPRIVENYDEFNNKSICKLDSYQIAKDSSLISARRTYITLTPQNADTLKVKLSTVITNNYPSLSNDARIVFNIVGTNGKTETLSYHGHDHKYVTEWMETYTQYGTIRQPLHKSSVNFILSRAELDKIIHAKEVSFTFEAKDEPITGTLENDSQEAFKEFLAQCYKSRG